MMLGPTNHLLAALPSIVGRALTLRLKRDVLYPHQVLFDVREPIRRVYFPIDAVISLLIPLSNGQTVETAMVGRDGVIGALAAFGAKHSASRAVVQVSGECLVSEVEALTSAMANIPELRSIIISHEQALLSHAQQSAACNATHNLESRLARRLLRAIDLHGGHELLLTHDHLAQMLGARRTTVTLIAQSFQDAGMIRYRRGRIVICDPVKLQNVACECYRAVKSNYECYRSQIFHQRLSRLIARSGRHGSNSFNVRFWPKADMDDCTAHVRYRGESGHGLSQRKISAFDQKTSSIGRYQNGI